MIEYVRRGVPVDFCLSFSGTVALTAGTLADGACLTVLSSTCDILTLLGLHYRFGLIFTDGYELAINEEQTYQFLR